MNDNAGRYHRQVDLLDTLRPETAIFSCGDNDYGHPSNRVLDALQALTTDAGIGTTRISFIGRALAQRRRGRPRAETNPLRGRSPGSRHRATEDADRCRALTRRTLFA